MNLKKIIIEIFKSGVISLLIGTGILLTAPDVFWGLVGFFFVIVGAFTSNEYVEKSSIKNQERRMSE